MRREPIGIARKRGQISDGRVVAAIGRSSTMPQYIPSPRDWVREQVELYESSGGTRGTTLRDTGLPVILVTHTGNKTGAIRKTPLMRVKDGDSYVLVGSQGGAPKNPVWVLNLIRRSSFAMRPSCVRCRCARSRTRLSGIVC